ncbi:cobalt-precorrin-5B (C(1))-methyltransferase [Aphanothece hegewaldii CCALA 016]|uniref:Cobalt-precorrin-5B C(1)-methyltransferase n=1 Tax=Aphanothece hegewaldii CCALA 016 TaxID=2107694 RepID=A0A2T1M2C9_9CHRO|nr:cobalt-precorrin-5B (C(1))-methyltransferase CbiD [Aphanothece hegewaldii]PSF38903.1 cobalt-precorrin-5B (C(1))-methyltransferase [Aphanothece hegewaldii CCALA 016]
MTARSGYTLPVFACASAIAAVRHLHGEILGNTVLFNLIEPPQIVEIPIEQVAKISSNQALAITRSDPGDNLDITKNTPIWALVEITENTESQIILKGGEGIGIQINNEGKAAIYSYAQRLLYENLRPFLKADESITVTIILPEGKNLAERTSNAAFGVVEGLSLLGTRGISEPLSAPEQLDAYQEELSQKASQFETLVFCVGENGRDLAQKMGINPAKIVKTANWIGPMLVTAALSGVKEILLFGYHGKLIKLAGGIFHTHHHLADGRLEILTAHCANVGLPTPILQKVFESATTEIALKLLREAGNNWAEKVYGAIASTIDLRCQDYIRKHAPYTVEVGSVLFDRDRSILISSQKGMIFLSKVSPKTDDN